MSTQEQHPEGHAPALPTVVPPTRPGQIGVERPPVWPSVVAVVCIVWGTLGLLGSIAGLLSPLYEDYIKALAPQAQGSFAMAERNWGLFLLYYVISVVMSLWLIWGGAMLFQRKTFGARLLMWWAIAEFPLSLVGIVVNHFMQKAQMEAMAAQGGNAPGAAVMAAITPLMTILSTVIVVLFSWALPAFLVIWLTRPGVKRGVERWFVQG